MIAIAERVEINIDSNSENKLSGPQILSSKLFDTIKSLKLGFNCQETAGHLGCSSDALQKRVFVLYRRFGIEKRKGENWGQGVDRLLSVMDQQGFKKKEKPLLSQRQLELLKLKALKKSVEETANSLRISVDTVYSSPVVFIELLK